MVPSVSSTGADEMGSIRSSLRTNLAGYSETCFGVSLLVSSSLESAGTTSSGSPAHQEIQKT